MRRWAMMCLTLLTGCASVAAERPTGDMKGWKSYRVEVGDNIVSFMIPPDESKKFINHSIPGRIDVAAEGGFDEAGMGLELLDRYWDYRKSRFIHVEGTLHFYIRLARSETLLENLDSLQKSVEESDRLLAAKQYIEEGDSKASNKPIKFEHMQVAGRDGFRVTYEISGPIYMVALDDLHYIQISYSAGGFSDPAWRKDALVAGMAILRSIRIQPRQ